MVSFFSWTPLIHFAKINDSHYYYLFKFVFSFCHSSSSFFRLYFDAGSKQTSNTQCQQCFIAGERKQNIANNFVDGPKKINNKSYDQQQNVSVRERERKKFRANDDGKQNAVKIICEEDTSQLQFILVQYIKIQMTIQLPRIDKICKTHFHVRANNVIGSVLFI